MLHNILLAVALGCGCCSVYADDAPTPTIINQTKTVAQPPAVDGTPGGYTDVSVNDPDVQAAAKFAVQQMQQGTLVKITSAQVQVVAGKNYSLQLLLLQSGDNYYQYSVIVFVPLPSTNQPMQLSNVQALGQGVNDSTYTNSKM